MRQEGTVLAGTPMTDILEAYSRLRVDSWLAMVAASPSGLSWTPLGGIENNVHTVEVSADPALALVERPVNSIDAVLDLKARELGVTAPTPKAAAQLFWPDLGEGVSLEDARRIGIQVALFDSGEASRPTIAILDHGTGQHPADFPTTLLSLLASNKKTKTHQMGLYNAGGAASARFANATVVVSRLAPQLLAGRVDQVGVTVIRYDPLDPDSYRSGSYVYAVARDGSILTLPPEDFPGGGYGTVVLLVEYELSRYVAPVDADRGSVVQLLNAALPAPVLPMCVSDYRGKTGELLAREPVTVLVNGIVSRLADVAVYEEQRNVRLSSSVGAITVRYFVIPEGADPDRFATSDQGLTITLNGQRQMVRDRFWVKRMLELPFIFRRLFIFVDATGLGNAARREVFSSTRESAADTPSFRELQEAVLAELRADQRLVELDEAARTEVLASATRSTTARVKRQLAGQIGAYVKGGLGGTSGGARRGSAAAPGGEQVHLPEDRLQEPELPEELELLNDPVRVRRGGVGSVRLLVKVRDDFFPRAQGSLSVMAGAPLAETVRLRAVGRVHAGRLRLTLEADLDCPVGTAPLTISIHVPDAGIHLQAEGTVEVYMDPADEPDPRRGGDPDIEVSWVGREAWHSFDPPWDGFTVGQCLVERGDLFEPDLITRVEWILNSAFLPYEQVLEQRHMGEAALKQFREQYEYPVLYAMFCQVVAERAGLSGEAGPEAKGEDSSGTGGSAASPLAVRAELMRMAIAVLMALEPGLAVSSIAAPG